MTAGAIPCYCIYMNTEAATENYSVECSHCGTAAALTHKQAASSRSKVCQHCGRLFYFAYLLPCEPSVSWLQGTWLANCPCGWSGELVRGGPDDAQARAAAQAQADDHGGTVGRLGWDAQVPAGTIDDFAAGWAE